MPIHFRSLIGKTEIRHSLDGLRSREARTKASRLSVVAQTFFELVEELQRGRIQVMHATCKQRPEFISGIIRNLDTFWFTAACEKNLSSAALVLKLPDFFRECGNACGIKEEDSAPEEQRQDNVYAAVNERTDEQHEQSLRKPRRIRVDGSSNDYSKSELTGRLLPSLSEALGN